MFDIGIFAPFGDDHQRNLAFCNDTAVRHIVLSVGNVEQDDSGHFLAACSQRFLTIGGFDTAEAQFFQNFASDTTNDAAIVDNQTGFHFACNIGNGINITDSL